MAITIPNKLWIAPWGKTWPDAAFKELTPYIAFEGLQWSVQGVEAHNSGRTQDSNMHINRVGIKVRLDVNCTPLSADNMKTVLQTIKLSQVWLAVRYYDPQEGAYRVAKMYTNNISSKFLKMNKDGTSYWQGLQFPLIEQ